MAKNEEKIDGTPEAWEDGLLGLDDEFVGTSSLKIEDLDDSLGLQPISIRLQKGLLDDLKMIARVEGIGYQPLIKQLLNRFVKGEHKKYFYAHMRQLEKEREAAGDENQEKVV